MLKAQLVESNGFQFREQDLQNEIHLRTDIIEDLQRQVASWQGLYESEPPKVHPKVNPKDGTHPK
eukprot:14096122-Heterocapsa_arctica.AAC.1